MATVKFVKYGTKSRLRTSPQGAIFPDGWKLPLGYTPPGNPEIRGPAKGAIGPAFRFVLVKNADTTYYREDSECHTTTVSEVHANSRSWDQPPQDPQDLESELKKVPFRPFRIVTATGKSHGITIEDRPLLLVGKRTAIIGLRVPDADPYIVHLEPIALPH